MSPILASGTRVSLRYAREAVRNTTPAGIGTPVTSLLSTATSTEGAGFSDFTRATGSFITDGYVKGQRVTTAGFTTAANNGTWRVHLVTALTLTVVDLGDVVTNEILDVAQTCSIALQSLRATSRSVNLEKNELESQEVDPDGQETDVRHGFNRVVGSPGYQFSRADFDDMIELGMGGAWEEGIGVTGGPTIAVTAATKLFTRSAGSYITDGFRIGDIIRTGGFTAGGNNGDWRVAGLNALTMQVADPGALMVDEATASRTLVLPGKRIDVSTTLATFLVERAFSDISQYQVFNGVVVDEFGMSVSPEAIIGGTLAWLGMSAAVVAGATIGSVAPVGSSGNSPYAAFDGAIYEGGSLVGVVTSMDFNLTRARSLNPVVGSKFSPDVFEGTARCTGTLSAYFEDAVLLNKFVNETESSLWVKFDDPNSATEFANIVLPRVKYTGAELDPPQEGPVPLSMPYRALKATGLAVPGGTTRNSLMTIQVSDAIGS